MSPHVRRSPIERRVSFTILSSHAPLSLPTTRSCHHQTCSDHVAQRNSPQPPPPTNTSYKILDSFVFIYRRIVPPNSCVDPESFVRGGPTLTFFYLVDEGREDPKTNISGPSSAASETPFKWRFAGVPMMTQH